ncbi:MAG: cupin domain-containing protein [Conexibacter sp.]
MIEKVRRVVMGEPAPGTSRFTHVEEVEAVAAGEAMSCWLVWGWDALPTLPHDSVEPFVPRSYFPPPGGLRISATRFGVDDRAAAEQERPDDTDEARIFTAEPCGLHEDRARPGMHRTDSIDIGVVVAGEVTVEADDGSTVLLGPGDIYIQNGALHRWHANPDRPAHVVFVGVGTTRDGQ